MTTEPLNEQSAQVGDLGASGMQLWFRCEKPVTKWHAVVSEKLPPSGQWAYRLVVAPCGYAAVASFAGFVEEEAGVLPIMGFDDDRGCCLLCQRALEMARREDER